MLVGQVICEEGSLRDEGEWPTGCGRTDRRYQSICVAQVIHIVVAQMPPMLLSPR